MSQQLVSDEFWERVAPLLPVVERRHRYPGRKRVDDRACLEAIMYVLKTGCQWAMVPAEVTGCSGKTAWRRMDQWGQAGVWDKLHDRQISHRRAGIAWASRFLAICSIMHVMSSRQECARLISESALSILVETKPSLSRK